MHCVCCYCDSNKLVLTLEKKYWAMSGNKVSLKWTGGTADGLLRWTGAGVRQGGARTCSCSSCSDDKVKFVPMSCRAANSLFVKCSLRLYAGSVRACWRRWLSRERAGINLIHEEIIQLGRLAWSDIRPRMHARKSDNNSRP